jgi:hypothetical protein
MQITIGKMYRSNSSGFLRGANNWIDLAAENVNSTNQAGFRLEPGDFVLILEKKQWSGWITMYRILLENGSVWWTGFPLVAALDEL